MIPSSALFDQSVLQALLDHDPVVQEYRTLFAALDWSLVENRPLCQPSPRRRPGRPAHPSSAYLKAFLVRLHPGLPYMTQLRDFLLKHPLLVIELGFHLVLDPTAPYGFDCAKTVPCRYWLGEVLHRCDQGVLQDLLASTVSALQASVRSSPSM
jgi:hypothetical protein